MRNSFSGILLVGLAAACSPPSQDYNTIPVCDAVDTNCRCKIDGWILCGDYCVNPKSSRDNCGSCGNSCSGVCVNGTCASSCGQYPSCGDHCVVPGDASNCGSCGNVCSTGEVCMGASCMVPCTGSMVACNGSCVDTNADSSNCGGCGNVCTFFCSNGTCQCDAGQTNCGGRCVDTNSSNQNCGGCGNACSSGTFCSGGFCQ